MTFDDFSRCCMRRDWQIFAARTWFADW